MDFDPDFASPYDWAVFYRSRGWQAVPCLAPQPPPAQWKRPAIKWREHERELVDNATFETWFRGRENGNSGILTGPCSGNLFVVDLDTYKSPDAAQWWAGVLAVHNNASEIETVEQVTGGGGRQLFFIAPPGWIPPTNKTAAGVDFRGAGGFVVVAPALHDSGRRYAWVEGRSPADLAPAVAPAWLCEAISALVASHGGNPDRTGAAAGTVTPSPAAALSPFGLHVDKREDLMMRHVWGHVVAMRRDAPMLPPLPEQEAAERDGFAWYVGKIKSRLAPSGGTPEALLEREGRGWSAWREKWRYAMARWNTKVTEEADKPRSPGAGSGTWTPVPLPAEPTPAHDPETGEIREPSKPGDHSAPELEPDCPPDDEFAAKPPPEGEKPWNFSPMAWGDVAQIEPRQFVYGRHYIRKFVSVDIAPGGVGKSSLAIADSIAMAAGRDIVGTDTLKGRLRVAYWCGEDPLDELMRRYHAARIHHRLTPAETGNRLFVDSGRVLPIILATSDRHGTAIATPMVAALVAAIRYNRLDVLIVDPFVASHAATENDNGAIQAVTRQWAHIADETNIAINLVHHARKTNGGEVTVEDGRGASALLAAARSARSFNAMSLREAERFGIPEPDRRRYFRVDDGKSNLAPPAAHAAWFRLASVTLPNGPLGTDGDNVGVVEKWTPPEPPGETVEELKAVQVQLMECGGAREDSKADDWVGYVVGEALGLADIGAGTAGRAVVLARLKGWLESGALVVENRPNKARQMKRWICAGVLAS